MLDFLPSPIHFPSTGLPTSVHGNTIHLVLLTPRASSSPQCGLWATTVSSTFNVVCEQTPSAPPSVWSVSKHRQLHLQCGLWTATISSTFKVVLNPLTSLEPSTGAILSRGPLSFLDLCHGLLMEVSASISACSQFCTQESEWSR